MPLTATLDDLRAMPYFAPLSDREAAVVARRFTVRTVGPREVIIAEGEPVAGYYLVRSGRTRIFRTGPEGREQTMRILGPGETFGEVPVFDGGTSPATVETLERSEVVLIPTEVLHDVVRHYPEVGLALLAHFARHVRSFTELIQQISMQTVQSRLARYLHELARVEGVEREGELVVPRELTVQDLASLLGSVREVVSRTLHDLERDGLVTIRRREIVIHDLAELRALA